MSDEFTITDKTRCEIWLRNPDGSDAHIHLTQPWMLDVSIDPSTLRAFAFGPGPSGGLVQRGSRVKISGVVGEVNLHG